MKSVQGIGPQLVVVKRSKMESLNNIIINIKIYISTHEWD